MAVTTQTSSRAGWEPDTPSRWRRIRRNPWFQRLVVWGGIIVAWEIYGRVVGEFFFATFSASVRAIGTLISDGQLSVFAESFGDMLIGYLLAVVIGVTLGFLGGALKPVGDVVRPYSMAAFVTSLEALVPFLIVVFGPGVSLKIAVVTIFAVFYILFNVEAGIRNSNAALIETARSFQAGRVRTYLEVVIPGALPYLASGLRMGLGMAIKGLIVAELWVSTGIGRLLRGYAENRAMDKFLAVVLILVVVGAGSVRLLEWLQDRAFPWSRREGAR